MGVERELLLSGVCLVAGYAFGSFLTAEIVARCLAGVGVRALGNGRPSADNVASVLGKPAGIAVVIGDVVKTVLACWFCAELAAPELEYRAVLYGGFGAILGQRWPLWLRGRGGFVMAVFCTWLVLCLPVTGALCVLAGIVVGAGTGSPYRVGWVSALLAIPVAWLQFGPQSALWIGMAAMLQVRRRSPHKKEEKKKRKTDRPVL